MTKVFYCVLVLVLVVACNTNSKENSGKQTEIDDTPAITENSDPDTKEIQNRLIGNWKRISYPYDQIVFKENETKYTEGEGAEELPKFEPYKIASECPFASKKIDDLPNKIHFVVYPERESCQLFELTGDTLNYYIASNSFIAYHRAGTD
ncbi:MAG: hypothetical protein WBG71_13825 [Leeuwenhoekiella sp.]